MYVVMKVQNHSDSSHILNWSDIVLVLSDK